MEVFLEGGSEVERKKERNNVHGIIMQCCKIRRIWHNLNFNPFLILATEPWDRALPKVVLTFVGFFLWGTSLFLLFGGIFVILTYKNYGAFFPNQFFPLPGWLAILTAALLLLAGLLAVYNPVRNSHYSQGILMYLLLVLFCLETSSVAMTQVYSAKACYQLKSSLGHFFHQYNGSSPHHCSTEMVNAIHKQLKCCGIYNYTDWTEGLPKYLQNGHVLVPESCCKETFLDCNGDLNQSEKLFKEGCLMKLQKRLRFITQYMDWCCVLAICLEILAAISNGILMKAPPAQDFHIMDSSAFS
ncbi:tetraspanin-3-like [Thamnophis elegans]|uniref:tetraspanin-3-like n=1 Tax=Thamnophis elegans TaxID=35005 RepID=UPI0013788317|nr:tetraspanin-3-like [Thamnophis elegans]